MSNELVNRAETAAIAAEAAAQAAKESENAAKASQEAVALDKAEVGRLVEHINNDQLVSIQNSKEAIRQAIVSKGQECDTDVPLADYAGLISNINAADFSEATPADEVSSGDLRDGKKLYNGAGELVIGTAETVTELRRDGNVVYAPKGIIDSELSETVPEMENPSVADNVVTIGKGYNKAQQTVTIPEAEVPTTSGNVVTVKKGYQAEEKQIPVGTAKAAETITPGTADKTIAADTYLSGALTIKGEPNWTEENIADGVSMWGKVGTHKSGIDTSTAVPAAAEDTRLGKEFFANGSKFTGTMPDAEIQFANIEDDGKISKRITISSGYLAEDFALDYNEEYPDLTATASDIRKGKTAIAVRSDDGGYASYGVVTGTLEEASGCSMEFYKCASVDTENKTWSGYKAVLTDGVYSFEEAVTEGLSYSVVTPEVGKIYSADATVQVGYFYMGKALNDMNSVFLIRASNSDMRDEINNIVPTMNGTVAHSDGVATFDRSYLSYNTEGLNKLNFGATQDFTVEYVTATTKLESNYPSVISNKTSWSEGCFCGIKFGNNRSVDSGYRAFWNPGDPLLIGEPVITSYGSDIYRHQAIVRKGDTIMMFVDGKLMAQTNNSNHYANFTSGSYGEGLINIGKGTWDGDDGFFYGNLLWLRISDTARYDSDFTPEDFWYDYGDTPDSGDKQYVYTVTGGNNVADFPEAVGNYYEISGEELDALYPQNNEPLANGTGPYYTNGGPYYLTYNTDTQTCFLQYYFSSDEYKGWEQLSTTWATGVNLPATGEWTDGWDVVAYSGGGDTPDTPDAGDKEYVYTLTNAGTASVNGDYWETGELHIAHPIYTNGNVYIAYDNSVADFAGWFIADSLEHCNPTDALYNGANDCDKMVDTEWETNNGESPVPTVSGYAGGGGSSGDDKTYEITVSDATGDHVGANGNYWRIDPPANMWSGYNTTDYGVWTNGTYYIAYCSQYWTGWTIVNNIELDPSSGTDIRAAYVMAAQAPAGSTPAISGWDNVTVTLYSGNKEYKYTVSGATGGKSGANGDYWQIEPPAYINSNYDQSCGVYTNGIWYMAYCTNYWWSWNIATDISVDPVTLDTTDGMIAPGVSDTATPVGTWSIAEITVADYAG